MPSMQILRRDRGLMSRIMTYCGSGERAGEGLARCAREGSFRRLSIPFLGWLVWFMDVVCFISSRDICSLRS